uniref:Uncharacterized protein n=1 Tax=Lygus hesperus TaxID=30085 RepID=A0A146LVM8_LYGHE
MECARVIAMGLEESVQTRYDKDATYDDVDRHAMQGEDYSNNTRHGTADGGDGSSTFIGSVDTSRMVSRSMAESLAAGVIPASLSPALSQLSRCTDDNLT